MANLRPFKAVLPKLELASDVPTRSFLTYDREKRKALLDKNPYSFLHVLFPGYDMGVRLRGDVRFEAIRKQYVEFLNRGVFERHNNDGFYLYAIQKENINCCGLICGVSSQDYDSGVIRKHEDTISKRVDLFTDYLEIVRFNAEPVLLTHRKIHEWDQLMAELQQESPELEIHYEKGETHKLWAITDPERISEIQSIFNNVTEIYIADGHHRCASSAQLTKTLSRKNPHHTGKEAYNHFLGYLIPENDIKIFEFNRIISDLNGLTVPDFLKAINKEFDIERARYPDIPKKKHQFGMYLDGNWYVLRSKATGHESGLDPLENLDAQILYSKIIQPILGIEDLRTDSRIQYLFGKDNLSQMKKMIDERKYVVGFGLAPTGVDEMMAIADAGAIMPPKSTYIEPKLLSGLTIYEF